jgi:hypothetical protein
MFLYLSLLTLLYSSYGVPDHASKIPIFSVNDRWTFSESFHSEIDAKSSGNAKQFEFPEPSQSTDNGNLRRDFTVLSTDQVGLPNKFSITYNIQDPKTATADSPVIGKSFSVDITLTKPVVSSPDAKEISEKVQQFVIRDSKRMLDYIAAMKQFAGLNIGTEQEQELSVELGCSILGLPSDQVDHMTIKLVATKPSLKYSLTILSKGDIKQQITTHGVLSIKYDWSTLNGSLTTSSTKEVSSDATNIKVESNTSLDIVRELAKH